MNKFTGISHSNTTVLKATEIMFIVVFIWFSIEVSTSKLEGKIHCIYDVSCSLFYLIYSTEICLHL